MRGFRSRAVALVVALSIPCFFAGVSIVNAPGGSGSGYFDGSGVASGAIDMDGNAINNAASIEVGNGSTATAQITSDLSGATDPTITFGDASITASSPILIPDGSVTAPSLAFTSDADGSGTGFYRSAANEIGAAINGVNALKFKTPTWTLFSTGGSERVGFTYDANTPSLKMTQSTTASSTLNPLALSFGPSATQDTGLSRVSAAVVGVGNGTAGNVSGTVSLSSIVHNDGGTKPTCDSSTRGKTWYDQGGAGVADTFEICMKDSGDAYGWKVLATP